MLYNCDYCGEEYNVRPHKLTKNKHNFCCVDCRTMYSYDNLTDSQEEVYSIIKNMPTPVTLGFLEALGFSRGNLRHIVDKLELKGLIKSKWINGKTKGYYEKENRKTKQGN